MGNRELAINLAKRPYDLVVFRDRTTDDSFIYMAVNPELEGCMAQGETIGEAEKNLAEFRVSYIEHLLDYALPVPEPHSVSIRTESVSIPFEPVEVKMWDATIELNEIEMLDGAIQPKHRELLFEASLQS